MKALLIGSSFSAMPFLVELKKLGFDVTVIGKYKADPCHAYADSSIYKDYSDPEILIKVCKDGNFDFIIPTCNDYSYVAGSYVASSMGLPGFDIPETTAILHTKDKFRQFCVRSGIPAPLIYGEIADGSQLDEIRERMEGAVLVKPVDSFSGRGVQLIQGTHELPGAVTKAMDMSRSRRVVVEEYVEGSLHSHTAFIAGGAMVWHQFVDEFCEVYPYQVDRSTFPTILPAAVRNSVHRSMQQVVDALGLCDGLLHTQFIASKDKYWIIECMRRCPGDLYGHHFKFSFGYNYEAQYLAGFIGQSPQSPMGSSAAIIPVERRVLSVSDPAAFFAVELPEAGPSTVLIPLKESGQKLDSAPFDKAGILFMKDGMKKSEERLRSSMASMLFHD